MLLAGLLLVPTCPVLAVSGNAGQGVPAPSAPGSSVAGFSAPAPSVAVSALAWSPGEATQPGSAPASYVAGTDALAGVATVNADSAVATLEKATVPIGSPVIVNIEVASASSEFVPPSALALAFPDWEVCESQRLQLPPRGSQQRWRYRVALQSWQLGKQTIPPLEIGGVSTSPLTVEITRPAGTTLALEASSPWATWGERYGNGLALGAAALGALVLVGGVEAIRRYQNRPERAMPRQARAELLRALAQGEAGWSVAEEAVRTYLGWKLALGEQALTLKELAERTAQIDQAQPAQAGEPPVQGESGWAALLNELAARKYCAAGADGTCAAWVQRALTLLQPDAEGKS